MPFIAVWIYADLKMILDGTLKGTEWEFTTLAELWIVENLNLFN